MLTYSVVRRRGFLDVNVKITCLRENSYTASRSDMEIHLEFDKPPIVFKLHVRVPTQQRKKQMYRKKRAFRVDVPQGYVILQEDLYKEERLYFHKERVHEPKYRGGIYSGSNLSSPYLGGGCNPR